LNHLTEDLGRGLETATKRDWNKKGKPVDAKSARKAKAAASRNGAKAATA
jgi:hypothetical protein